MLVGSVHSRCLRALGERQLAMVWLHYAGEQQSQTGYIQHIGGLPYRLDGLKDAEARNYIFSKANSSVPLAYPPNSA